MPNVAHPWLRLFRLLVPVLVLAAVAVQFDRSVLVQARPAGHFFSFFTIQSNLIAAGTFMWLAAVPDRARRWPGLERLRVSVATYLTVTFIVYGVLLSDLQEQLQVTIPWVDTTLHKLVPVLVIADWLLAPPGQRLSLRPALVALAYPIGWLAWTLIRGPIVGWYPYPFLDPAQPGGYTAVAVYSVVITLGAVGVLSAMVAVGDRGRLARATGKGGRAALLCLVWLGLGPKTDTPADGQDHAHRPGESCILARREGPFDSRHPSQPRRGD